ncbi:DUF1996 domain-containing protein [Lentzea tibetensis]
MSVVATAAVVLAVKAGANVGLAAADGADESSFVDITKVKTNVKEVKEGNDATTGTFTVDCGRNEEEHFNPDNFIAQPGVRNGAAHLHDYVGNLSTDAGSNLKSLEKADTTCGNGDKSTYFWPVLRINKENNEGEKKSKIKEDGKKEDGKKEDGKKKEEDNKGKDENKDGPRGEDKELEDNEGEIQRPEVVDLAFRGSPVGEVVAMPKFLKILYGEAKVGANGDKNARASWTCTGFEEKVLINKYPICPQGSKIKRIHDFASCWDGKNTDSENHRDHIVYPKEDGTCEKGFKAVPQLRISLTYNIPRDVQVKKQYAIDSFPEEQHDPFSDHDDFANVMSQQIMNRLVNCINTGKRCKE